MATPLEHDRPLSPVAAGRRLAAVPVALSIAGGVLAVVAAATTDHPGPGAAVRAGLVSAWAVAAIALSVRGGRTALGMVAAAAAAVGGVCAATAGRPGLGSLHTAAAALLPAIAFHLALGLPDGALGRGARRTAAVAGYGASLVAGAALAIAGASPSVWAVAGAVVAALVLAFPAANQRYVHSVGIARQRLQLIGCGVAVAGEAAVVLAALRVLVGRPHATAAVAAAFTAVVPLAIALGTSSKVVHSVDRLLLHTVSATGVTAVVVAVYVVVVIGLGRSPDDDQRDVLILSMVAAAVAAVLYVPARERLADTANRLVYGERHPPDEVLRTWGSRLSRSIPMDELLLQLAESLRKVMALQRAEVWTGTPDRLDLAVSVPDRTASPVALAPSEQSVLARAGVTGNAWLEVWLPALLEGRGRGPVRAVPACHSGEILGLLVVERQAGGDAFDEEDERVLAELARQLGLALHNVQLDSALQESLDELRRANEELQASRARIVATADAERRKIERNLHDGAQQHLVALAVNLRLAKDILGDDPDGAAEMLDALAENVKETIQELRDLAHGIYPPLLMDRGLPDALRAAAARSPLAVDVDADGVGRYSSEVEAAVYFCCLEALQNAAKHAPGATVDVRVAEDAGVLRFTVTDRGPGFDVATATAGHGYVNMSDRVGAIGGSVEWRSEPGAGATVAGEVPLAPPEAAER